MEKGPQASSSCSGCWSKDWLLLYPRNAREEREPHCLPATDTAPPLTLLQGAPPAAVGRPPPREGAGEEHVTGEGLLKAGAAGEGGVSPSTAQAFIREGPLECLLGGLRGRAETFFKDPATLWLSILYVPKQLDRIPGKPLSGHLLQCAKAAKARSHQEAQGSIQATAPPLPTGSLRPGALMGKSQCEALRHIYAASSKNAPLQQIPLPWGGRRLGVDAHQFVFLLQAGGVHDDQLLQVIFDG